MRRPHPDFMENQRFEAHVDQAVESLRLRLLADVIAAAERDQRRPGIRRDWKALVHRLAELRNTIGPPVQTPARNPES